MGLSRQAKWRRACLQKTAAGNVYRSRSHAEKVVLSIRGREPKNSVQAFQCPVCGKFHVGKPKTRPPKLRRRGGDLSPCEDNG